MSTSLLRMETRIGGPLNLPDTQVRVRSQVLQLRLPFIHGGLIWNRPVAVLVRTADGQDQILPIPDVTRSALITLLAFSLAGTILLRIFRRKTD